MASGAVCWYALAVSLNGVAAWAKRPENQVKIVGALMGTAIVATIAWYADKSNDGGVSSGGRGAKPKDAVVKGFVVCPKDVGKIAPPIAGLSRGDFVIIQLASADGKFVEPTWARVRSFSPTRDKMYVEISGEYTNAGIKPLSSDRHAFYLGEKIVLDKDCIFDVLRVQGKLTGQILCGPSLGVLTGIGGKPLYNLVDTKSVDTSNVVRVVVASEEAQGTAWHEPLWVHVTSISPTQHVIRGLVAETPKLTTKHGLKQYSSVEFGRDCVIGISTPYLLGAS